MAIARKDFVATLVILMRRLSFHPPTTLPLPPSCNPLAPVEALLSSFFTVIVQRFQMTLQYEYMSSITTP